MIATDLPTNVRNAYIILIAKPKDLVIDGMLTLKWSLRKYCLKM